MFGLFLCCVSVAGLLVMGMWYRGKSPEGARRIFVSASAVSSLMVLTGAIIAMSGGAASAAEGAAMTAAASGAVGMAYLAAGLSTGLACVGTGLAVSAVGSAALGLVGEKPEMLGTTLIYLGLAEGIAIYGVIISLLVLGKV